MKAMKELCEKLGIDQKAIDEAEVPIMQLLVSDQFNKPKDGSREDWRLTAINRAINARVNFTTETNTNYHFFINFVKIDCPACGKTITGPAAVEMGRWNLSITVAIVVPL